MDLEGGFQRHDSVEASGSDRHFLVYVGVASVILVAGSLLVLFLYSRRLALPPFSSLHRGRAGQARGRRRRRRVGGEGGGGGGGGGGGREHGGSDCENEGGEYACRDSEAPFGDLGSSCGSDDSEDEVGLLAPVPPNRFDLDPGNCYSPPLVSNGTTCGGEHTEFAANNDTPSSNREMKVELTVLSAL